MLSIYQYPQYSVSLYSIMHNVHNDKWGYGICIAPNEGAEVLFIYFSFYVLRALIT